MGKKISKETASELGRMGALAKAANEREKNRIIVSAITGDFRDYLDKLERLKNGEDLSKEEREYMDRVEKWIEHQIPKLSRTEVTGKDGKDLPTPILANVITDQKS